MYHKIPKISPGAYIFLRSLLRGLYLEGLVYGGKFAFQALNLEGDLPFLLCFTLYLRAISKYKPLAGAVSNRLLPLGGLYLEG